jgi:hypothetical protein
MSKPVDLSAVVASSEDLHTSNVGEAADLSSKKRSNEDEEDSAGHTTKRRSALSLATPVLIPNGMTEQSSSTSGTFQIKLLKSAVAAGTLSNSFWKPYNLADSDIDRLRTLLSDLAEAPYLAVTFRVEDGRLCKDVDIDWLPAITVYQELVLSYYRDYRAGLIEQFGKAGCYAVFFDVDKPPALFTQEPAANEFIHDQGYDPFFCVLVGCEDKIVLLVDLPPGAVRVDNVVLNLNGLLRAGSPASKSQFEGQYVAQTWRWINLPIERPLGERAYVDAWFLLDTGSRRSYINRSLRALLRDWDVDREAEKLFRIAGVRTAFGQSEACLNGAVKGLNLLGVNFINRFRFLDDFSSATLTLTTPPTPVVGSLIVFTPQRGASINV